MTYIFSIYRRVVCASLLAIVPLSLPAMPALGGDDSGVHNEQSLQNRSEALFGFGVWNRTAGAFLDIENSTYTDPTIT